MKIFDSATALSFIYLLFILPQITEDFHIFNHQHSPYGNSEFIQSTTLLIQLDTLNYFTYTLKKLEKFKLLFFPTSTPRLPHLSNTTLFLSAQTEQFPFPHLSFNHQSESVYHHLISPKIVQQSLKCYFCWLSLEQPGLCSKEAMWDDAPLFNTIQKLLIKVRTEPTLLPMVIKFCLPVHQLLAGPLCLLAYHLLIILQSFSVIKHYLFYCFYKRNI